jgi:cytochrome oxidase Cu insertion factor (SCO1/SenC/PrrC family)
MNLLPLAALAALLGLPAQGDVFSSMRVRRISPPRRVGNLVLHAADGRPLGLSAFRGKVTLVEFFLPG